MALKNDPTAITGLTRSGWWQRRICWIHSEAPFALEADTEVSANVRMFSLWEFTVNSASLRRDYKVAISTLSKFRR